MNEDFIITMQDLEAHGFCALGTRRWFIIYDIDFKDFLENGILASRLTATGDAMGIRAVQLVGANRGQQ